MDNFKILIYFILKISQNIFTLQTNPLKLIMLDQLTKLLAVITVIIPLLSVFDRSKRFLHNRKFFIERQKVLKEYLAEKSRSDVIAVEKDFAAQVLVGSDKIGHKEVDYLIEKYPHQFFEMVKELIHAKDVIRVEILPNSSFRWTTKRDKKELRSFLIKSIVSYFSSILIFYSNDISVYLMKLFNQTDLIIKVNAFSYLIFQIFIIIVGFLVASLSAIFVMASGSALQLYDDLKFEHVPR